MKSLQLWARISGSFLGMCVLVSCTTTTGLAVVGIGYQMNAVRNDRLAYPPTGRMVQVEGGNMHLDCRGLGSPTVILEAGASSSTTHWYHVHDAIAEFTRVCAYDRAGLGWSDPLHHFSDLNDISSQLDSLLTKANIEGPKILVGASYGGIYVRNYFKNYPADIKGMVLIDSSHEQQIKRSAPNPNWKYVWLAKPGSYLQATGLYRITGIVDGGIAHYEDNIRNTFSAQINQSHFIESFYYERKLMLIVDKLGLAPTSLGSLPLVILSSNIDYWYPEQDRPIWQQLQLELAGLSDDSRHLIAHDSGHEIHIYQPQLVIDEIRSLVERLRKPAN